MVEHRRSVMQVLKESTWDLHGAAESHQFQRSLVKGELPRSDYASFLSQMWLIHTALESHLRRLSDSTPFCRVIREYHFRESLLREDLQFLGREVHGFHTLPATSHLICAIDRSISARPVSALGFLYVLEGSTNGSTFIAQSVRRTFHLDGDQGTAYLDPHGSKLRERWASFKHDMDEQEFSEGDMQAMIGAAKEVFRSMIALSNELSHDSSASNRLLAGAASAWRI